MTTQVSKTQCVYTIVNIDVIKKAFEHGGMGEFQENTRWATALKVLESLEDGEIYPLMMANAASIIGVEWVAAIERIEIVGQRTKVTFSSLLSSQDPIPLNALTKASNGEPLDPNYIRPYVPCVIDGDLADAVISSLIEERDGGGDTGLAVIESKTSEDYLVALRAIENSITTNQRAMLIAHAQAPEFRMSTRSLADVAGYPSHGTANIQYGTLGRKFANFFEVGDLNNQTQAIAYGDGVADKNGHFTWVLREPLVTALQSIGWVKMSQAVDFRRQAAEKEVDDDPKSKGIVATVREALIDARIGQGAYRKRLIQIWNGKCALTGCDIQEVLIASHAKAWTDSTNDERLDEYNGLLLAAHVDKLFDCGLISFADDGKLLLKSSLQMSALALLGIKKEMQLREVHAKNVPYLKSHRAKFHFD